MTFGEICLHRLSLTGRVGFGIVCGLLIQTSLDAQPLLGPVSGVWVYPNDAETPPQAFSSPDWLLRAQTDPSGVRLVGESGSDFLLDVSDYRLVLVNQGDGGLSPQASGSLLGPVFSLSGLSAAEPNDLGSAVNVQIGPNQARSDQTLSVVVQARRPESESAVIELKVRVLCSPTEVLTPVSSNPADYDNIDCVAQSKSRSARSLAERSLVLADNQHYRIDAMARLDGGSFGSVVSKAYQISGAESLATRDADGDGIPDIAELELGLDFQDGNLLQDADGDGWSELDEWIRCDQADRAQCEPAPIDSDKDGWSDYDELNFRHTDPNDWITITDENGQPKTVAQPYGSEPTAQRLYEVEYRVSGRFYEQLGQQALTSRLADLSVLDIYGRSLFDQQSLPHYAAPLIAKANVPLESDLAPWNQASLYDNDLKVGELPQFVTNEPDPVTKPVLRFAAGLPSFLRVQQQAAGQESFRTPLAFVRWLDAQPDPTPARSGCAADLTSPDGPGLSWLDCYRSYLRRTLVQDLEGLSFGPEDAVDVALLGGLMAWVTPDADPSAYFLPGSRQLTPDPDAVARLRRLMPAELQDQPFGELHARLNQLTEPFGALDSMARSIEGVVENFRFYLETDPAPNTTQSHAADIVRSANNDELYALRLAVVTNSSDFATASFDSQSDQDGDGINGFDELADSRNVTNPRATDSDADGLSDSQDPCPRSASQSCLVASAGDKDGDGVADGLDNCPDHKNPHQEDTKSHPQFDLGQGPDGVGDACSDTGWAFIVKPGDDIRVMAGQPVSFLARVTEAVDNDMAFVNLTWEFGDGIANSQQPDPVRKFTSPGLTKVSLTADYNGKLSRDEIELEVIGSAEQTAVVTVSDLSVSELDGVVQLPIKLSLPMSQTVAVAVESIAGSATASSDFQPVNEQILFAPGQQEVLLNLTIIDDSEVESSEHFSIGLSLVNGPAIVGRSLAQVQIADDDVQGNGNPLAVDDSVNVLEDAGPLDIDVLANDSDPDADALILSAIGTASDPGAGVFSIVANQLRYEPAADYFADGITLDYTVSDGAGGSATATLTLNVAPVNDAPTFVMGPDLTVSSDSGAVTEMAWITQHSMGPDNESDQNIIHASWTTTNSHLFEKAPRIGINGDLTFTPSASASGSSTITYSIQDNGGTSDGGQDTSLVKTATITIVPFEQSITDQAVLDGQNGFAFYSPAQNMGLGAFVSSVPDMNGDPCDEILVSSQGGSGRNSVWAYLLFGADADADPQAGCILDDSGAKAETQLDDLLATRRAYRFSGIASYKFGAMAVSAGEVTEDSARRPDILIGSPHNEYETAANVSPGFAVLLKGEALARADTFGDSINDGDININELVVATNPSSVAYVFIDETSQKYLGLSVAGVGDVNGDKVDDFALLSVSTDNLYRSRVYVIFGGLARLTDLDDDDGQLDGHIRLGASLGSTGNGLVIETSAPGNGYLWPRAYPHVAALGDLNGDLVDDFAVTLPGAETNGNSDAGQIGVIYGGSSLNSQNTLSLDALDGSNGFRIESTSSTLMGRSLATAGDINGDSFVDLAFNSYNESNNWELAILYGGTHLTKWSVLNDDGAMTVADLGVDSGYRIERVNTLHSFAFGMSFLGLSGKVADLLIGSDGDNSRGGYLDQLWGGRDPLNQFDLAFTRPGETEPGGRAGMARFNGIFGSRLRSDNVRLEIGNLPHGVAGQFDFNGDGVADRLIGEPDHSAASGYDGRFFILLGR